MVFPSLTQIFMRRTIEPTMENPMDENAKTRINQLRDLVKTSRGISVAELAEISVTAEEHGGQLVAVAGYEPGDDWCPTGRIRFKWPPKKGTLGSLIDSLINKGIGGHIIINGIPVPDEVMLEISRGNIKR